MAAPTSSRRRIDSATIVRAGFAFIVLAFFAKFAWPGLAYGFNGDDPANIYYHWTRFRELLAGLPLFFNTYCRPMGGLYFATLYYLFGLNPLPYHIVLTSLLLVNTYLAYRVARYLSGSELVSGVTALLMVYHARMPQIAYLPAFVFDVLCFTFYFLALNYYLRIRTRGGILDRKQIVAFLLLYIGSLESKEMGVTLPAIVLLYELIWRPPSLRAAASVLKWLRVEALPGLIAGALTAVYIAGKLTGAEALTSNPAYQTTFTWARYWESTPRFVNTIFYSDRGFFTPVSVTVLAIALLGYALLRHKEKYLLLMWAFLWIAPLPITFIPGRSGGMLYIPLFGWAVVLASIFAMFCGAAAKSLSRLRVPPKAATAVLVIAGIAWYWHTIDRKNWWMGRWAEEATGPGSRMIAQVLEVQPKVKRGAKIYVYNTPPGSWDTKFIMELLYGDRTTTVWLDTQTPLSQSEIDGMDYVFTFENGKLRLLRGAERPADGQRG